MALEEGFVDTHILDAHNSFAFFYLQYSVNQEEMGSGVAVNP
jgi:hypothetical protein